MTAQVNVHELANMTGAGQARQALIKAGCWDENVETGDKKTFVITVEYTRLEEDTEYLEVEATTKKQALEKAAEEFGQHFDYEEILEMRLDPLQKVRV